MKNTIHTVRKSSQLAAGNLVHFSDGRRGFVAWVEIADGETSCDDMMGYIGLDGTYHETSAPAEIVVWLEHPLIGKHRAREAEAMSWEDA